MQLFSSANVFAVARRAIFALALGFGALVVTPSTVAHAQDDSNWLPVEVGKSVIIELPRTATTIAVTDPDVANVQTLSTTKIMVQGIAVGSTDIVIQQQGTSEALKYQITVSEDLSDLVRRVGDIVEGEPPSVYPLKDRIVVQGQVDDLDTLERVAQVARVYDKDFVNLMTVRGDHQVQLEVTFAEVSRTALRELGINWAYLSGDGVGQLTGPNSTSATSQVMELGDSSVTVPAPSTGTFQLLGAVTAVNLAAVISALDDYRISKYLAQPTIACLSGQQCEFLAGGEIPYPAPTGNGAVSIVFKEYGVKLSFVPTVLGGNVIDMRVYVEVSEPDYSVSSRAVGLEVNGFISRKGKTHLRLDSGMTFAMAGMVLERMAYSRAEVPLLGRIPVVGTLFRYTKHSRTEQEVVIYVTPRLIRPLGPGEVPAAPGTTENNNPTDLEFFLLGMDHRPGSRTAEPSGDIGLQR